jgi:glycosyltransferase involved in cell wall biosynthesis
MSDITVLMSVYKSEKPDFLNKSLQSIWDDQELKPCKIVLVQDGPISDELYQVIFKWQSAVGDRFVLIRNEKNIGLTKSLIEGLQVIDTKYVARMDSDDISYPGRFKKQMEFLESHPEIAVVGCSIQEFSESQGDMGIRRFPLSTKDTKKCIYKANPLAHPAVMMRRRMFDEGISYNSNYRTTQDLALWFDVLSAGYEVANLEEVLLRFRREDNIYHRRSNWKDSWLEFKIHEKGIYKLYGFSPYKSLFPVARFMVRFLPSSILKKLYNGKLREKVTKS